MKIIKQYVLRKKSNNKYVKTKCYQEVYTDNINEAQVFKSKGGALNSAKYGAVDNKKFGVNAYIIIPIKIKL